MSVRLVNDVDFETEIYKNEKVVVKYTASWCGSCRLFAPKFKRISTLDQFDHIHFLTVDTGQSPLARRIGGVTNLPAFAIFKHGELMASLVSNQEDEVIDFINKLS